MRLQKVQDELKKKAGSTVILRKQDWEALILSIGGSVIISGNLMRMVWERRVISVLQEEQRILPVRIMKNRLCSW